MSKSTKTYISSNLVWFIKAGLFACLFMPLIVHSNFIFPYIFPKQAFFQIVVEIVFALYLFLALKNPEFRPRSSWLFKSLLVYFLIMILSSVFGVNTYHSFWSNYERMAGVVSLLHYLGFLFMAVNVFKTQDDWHNFFDFSILASVLQAFYGLGQLAKIFTSSGGVRIDGTIGNASFLAGYMLINALLALWLALEKKSFNWSLAYGGVIVLNLIILYQTQTRGAVLGLMVGLLALFLFFIFARQQDLAQLSFSRPERLKKYALALLVAVFLLGGLIWLGRDSSFIKNRPTLYRVTHISATEATAQTRLLAWRMSLQGFLERPLFGWGPENYAVLFNKYYNPKLYPTESWFDRSHNAYLDILVNTGLVGSLAYLAIVFLAFWYLWRAWRQGKINYLTAAIFTAIFLAYGIQNIFVFDTQVTLLMFYSLLAFIVFLSVNGAPADQVKPTGQPLRPNMVFKVFVFLLLIFFLYFMNIKPGLAGRTGIKALQSLQAGQVSQSLEQFNSAFEIGTFGLPEVAMRVQDVALSIIYSSQAPAETKDKFVALAIDGMNRALEQEPLNVRFMMILANIYFSTIDDNDSYLAQTDTLLQKAQELSPTRPELLFYVGQVRMFQNRLDEALALFKQAVELNDQVPLSHWNYGVVAINAGQKELGESEIKIARDMGHSYAGNDIRQIINAYQRANDVLRVIVLYDEWMKLWPNDAAAYADAADFYARMGSKDKAKELAQRAAAIDPNYKDQAAKFIEGLEN